MKSEWSAAISNVSKQLFELEKQLNSMRLEFQMIGDQIKAEIKANQQGDGENLKSNVHKNLVSVLGEIGNGRLSDDLEEFERVYIGLLITESGWSMSKVAKALGISRPALNNKCRKYDLGGKK